MYLLRYKSPLNNFYYNLQNRRKVIFLKYTRNARTHAHIYKIIQSYRYLSMSMYKRDAIVETRHSFS